ncbi:hemagglutinin [Xylella fastidiosa]|uniref:hemagglutinin n=1 Tax=Xylella fastidiosa TaxID=2371 RepID=UPI003AFB0E00
MAPKAPPPPASSPDYFSDPRPEDTAQDREAKRNLITSIVTGIASIGNTDPATATHAAIAAVDNNWLATQQKLQMENELKAARQKGFWAEEAVKAKWDAISAKQDILTTSTLLLGLAESAKSDLNGLVELVLHPIDTVNGLKALITDPAVRQQLGESLVQELNDRVDRIQANTIFGGDLDALEYGRGLGTVVWDVGALLVGVGGVAKGGELLAKAGIKVSEDVLERMAARNLEKLLVQQQGAFNKAIALVDKSNSSSEFVFSGLKAKITPPGSVGGSNKAGNVKVLESEAFSDQKIREYAQQLAGDVPLKETRTRGFMRLN